ncbi:hypothetical protein CPB86DRAFT_699413, partial [Serendipita vermifera]
LSSILPYMSKFKELRDLDLYSEKGDYAQRVIRPTGFVTPPRLPVLNSLRYQGRFSWDIQLLLSSVSENLRNLDLQVRVSDFRNVIEALRVCHSLRRFRLALLLLERDPRPSETLQLYPLLLGVDIPKWKLRRLKELRCEAKASTHSPIPHILDAKNLWIFFDSIFPNVRKLFWSIPFHSNTEDRASLALPRRYTFLDSLELDRLEFLEGVWTMDLINLSIFCHRRHVWSAPRYSTLRSLDVTIDEGVKAFHSMESESFPVLKVLTIKFLGPRCYFPFFNLPSLSELTISTRLPTFTQGMKFCASLACEPRNFPHLDQINLDCIPEWDILCVLLKRRNFLKDPTVSRIRRLGLPSIPPKLHSIFASLLGGRDIMPPPLLWSKVMSLSIQRSPSHILDDKITGCFSCLQMGLAHCDEPLCESKLPLKYRTNRSKSINFWMIEDLGLFPLYNWNVRVSTTLNGSDWEIALIKDHLKRAEEWSTAAYEWSKAHHRTLRCHRLLYAPKIIVTEHDM